MILGRDPEGQSAESATSSWIPTTCPRGGGGRVDTCRKHRSHGRPAESNARGGDPTKESRSSTEVVAFARWFVDWWLARPGRPRSRGKEGEVALSRRCSARRLRARVDRGAGQGLLARRAARGDPRSSPPRTTSSSSASTATSTPAGRRPTARPEFQRLMADAAERRFDVVLVYHTSRFARNQVEARRYKQLLRERLGIRVVSVTQPMGEDHTDPSVVPRGVDPRDVRRVLLRLAVVLDPQRPAREGHARATSSAASRGATSATPTASSPSRTLSGRRSCGSCSSATPPATSPTAASPTG